MRKITLLSVALLVGFTLACGGGGADVEVDVAIASLPEPGSDGWDEEVKDILLGAYDYDRSGTIDSQYEVDAVPCSTWAALDTAILASSYSGNFHQIYGFAPGTIWVGNAVGFDQSLQTSAMAAITQCGLTGAGPAPAIPGAPAVIGTAMPPAELTEPLAQQLYALDDPGSSEWDAVVKPMLLAAHDTNGSSTIDTPAEVGAISCQTLKSFELAYNRVGRANFYTIYGFAPDFIWVGGAIGFDEAVREQTWNRTIECGIVDAPTVAVVERPPGAVPVAGPPPAVVASAGSPAAAIRALPDPATSTWDTAVKAILVPAYDTDRSGEIDTAAEIAAMPCDVWQALDAGVMSSEYEGHFYTVYGYNPDLIWLGNLVGMSMSVRSNAYARALECTGAAPPPSMPAPMPAVGPADAGKNVGAGGGTGAAAATARGTADPASGTWDTAVKAAMLAEYDANRSGELDTDAEIRSVSCDTWRALDEAVLRSTYSGHFYTIYGIAPDYGWVGYAVGISESMRPNAWTAIRGCGMGG